ncbi:MAG: glycosyltransferase family 4 protein [Bacteroidales bacterium]|nr:glycosyltransferase family 4 protein [Bacteroidales bacterium]
MKDKVLFIFPGKSAFINKDIGILSRRYDVITPDHTWENKKSTPLNFLKQLLFLIRNLKGSKAVFVMFGGYWSLLPALSGRFTGIPVYIIPGGTDCVSFPSLGYGSLRKPLMRTFIKWSFSLCTELLPVHQSLVMSDYDYHPGSDYRKQGFMYFFPKLRTPYRVIHNGFDPEFFKGDPGAKKAGSFIAVAPVGNMMRVRVKGVDLVIGLARRFPHCSFTIVGVSGEVSAQLGPLPSNLRLLEWLPQEKFIGLLEESLYVLQLSISEGFPNALCEAMLCHCIPIGSSVGPIPDIIGDTGYLIDKPDQDYLSSRIGEILAADPTTRRRMGSEARERVASLFHINRREKAFLDLLETP